MKEYEQASISPLVDMLQMGALLLAGLVRKLDFANMAAISQTAEGCIVERLILQEFNFGGCSILVGDL